MSFQMADIWDTEIVAATGNEPELTEGPDDHHHLRAVKPGTGISIIIPATNNSNITRQCTASILRTTEEPFEIIIVDNGSTSDESRRLSQLAHDQYLKFDHALGYAQAMNYGIWHARYPYICLTNSDIEFRTFGWNRILIWTLQHYNGSIVAPVIDNGWLESQLANRTYLPSAAYVVWLDFISVVMPRSLFTTVGMLDSRYNRWFPGNADDADFCYRTRLAGGKLLVQPSVLIHHLKSSSFGQFGATEKRSTEKAFFERFRKWGTQFYEYTWGKDALKQGHYMQFGDVE